MQRPKLDARSGSARARGLRNAHYGIDGQLKSGTDEVTGQPVNFPESTGDRLRPGPSAAWQKAFGRKPAVPRPTSRQTVMPTSSAVRTVPTSRVQPPKSAAVPVANIVTYGADSKLPTNEYTMAAGMVPKMSAKNLEQKPESAVSRPPQGAPVLNDAAGGRTVVTRANPYAERGARIRAQLAAEGRFKAPAPNYAKDVKAGFVKHGYVGRAAEIMGDASQYGQARRTVLLNERYKGKAFNAELPAAQEKLAEPKRQGIYDETGKRYAGGGRTPGVYDEKGAKFVSGDEKRRRLLNRASSGPQFSTPKVGTMPSYA